MHMMLQDDSNTLFVDAGGGMSLMQKILRGEIPKPEHLWITHCHSDHLLGIVHVLRVHKSGNLTIYCTQEIQDKIAQLMSIVGQEKLYLKQIHEHLIQYVLIDSGEEITI
jgi:ribonuclease Z